MIAVALCLASSVGFAKTTSLNDRPTTTKVAEKGRALLPIVISDKASPKIQKAAEALSSYLERISGAKFAIETFTSVREPDAKGITLGLASEFNGTVQGPLKGVDSTHVEDYLLRSHKNGLDLIGVSELGAEHAVWDFLHRLGYRYFFPSDKWEIVPRVPDITIAVHVWEHPDYLSRRIWYGFGSTKENLDAFYGNWWARNRTAMGIDLANAHEYASIILRNRATFEAHPEYYALIAGQRAVWNGAQFCISNPGLRKLVAEDALHKLELNPKLDSVSVEPNDGGGWCECAECKKVGNGSVSDRVVTLANEVATAVAAKYPGKFVGMLAYNEHSPPPSLKVHPNVVVSIANGFIKGGYTMDQLIEGWSQQAKMIGVYEYYSFFTWDWDSPGAARGGNLDFLKTSTVKYYQRGARFMSAESSNNWGPNGLGYYLAARLLWDTTEAERADEIITDFIDKSFGTARKPMAEWYRLIDGSNKPLLTTDLVGRMYRKLDQALKLTSDPSIRARIYDLVLYTRWAEMVNAPDRLPAQLQNLLSFSWRIRATNMIHTMGHWSISEEKAPSEARLAVPEPQNPWKSSKPYTAQEFEKIISDGIANNSTVTFTAIDFSDDLVLAAPLGLKTETTGTFNFFRDKAQFSTWIEKAPATIAVQVKCGVSTGPVEGTGKIALYPGDDPTGEATSTQSFPRDNKDFSDLQLKTTHRGLHTLLLTDGTAGTMMNWPEGTPLVFESGMRAQHGFQGKWTMYFYVPKGTKEVGGARVGAVKGNVLDSKGKICFTFGEGADKGENRAHWKVPVEPGQDAKLWQFQNIEGGEVRLMTVPPYLARNGQELLLPSEVVKADQRK